ncbi:MFS transporter [Nioella aestuarii]|uniref:MFS transporter n=1 Tax=Nioella aestuarii TaxID=1662864 RepID=UPI003D7F7511
MSNLFLFRRNRNFRWLLSGAATANLGDGVAAMALPWLATLISRDPVHIALVSFSTYLPWLLLALPVGVLTDRADRQKLMVRADLSRLVLSFGLVLLVLAVPSLPTQNDSLGLILMLSVLAFALGAAEVVRDNTAQTCLPMLVDEQDLEAANGQIWSIEQIMGRFIGPPVAGVLIALALPVPFSFNALAFGLAAFCVWSIVFPNRVPPKRHGSFVADMAGGIRWIIAHRIILQLAVMLGLLNALHMATNTILVLYAQEILGLGAFGFGMLLTAGALGGVVGGLACPSLAARLGPRNSLLLALATMPLTYLAMMATTLPLVAAMALFLSMLAGLLWNVVTVSYRQRMIPGDILGRVNSIYRFFGWGMMPLGALAGGVLVAILEPTIGREMALRMPFLMAAVGIGGLGLYALLFLKLGREARG